VKLRYLHSLPTQFSHFPPFQGYSSQWSPISNGEEAVGTMPLAQYSESVETLVANADSPESFAIIGSGSIR
jgi:hypothetical protein